MKELYVYPSEYFYEYIFRRKYSEDADYHNRIDMQADLSDFNAVLD